MLKEASKAYSRVQFDTMCLNVEVGKCVANLVHQLEVSDVEHIVPESVGLVLGWYADTI